MSQTIRSNADILESVRTHVADTHRAPVQPKVSPNNLPGVDITPESTPSVDINNEAGQDARTQAAVNDPEPNLNPNTNEIIKTLRLLHTKGVVELRAPKTADGSYSGYYDASAQFAADACKLASSETTEAVYHTLQDINPDLFNLYPNRLEKHPTKTTSDDDVIKYRWLPLDADPKRKGGVSSTDSEKAFALETAQKIRQFLLTYDIESILADSGNGYHLLVRIDLLAADKELVQSLLHSFSAVFSTDAVWIDTGVFNPSRIFKLYGTPSRKGQNTSERPWRMSRLLDVPEGIQNRPVTKEALESLLSDLQTLAPGGGTKKSENRADGSKILHGQMHRAILSEAGRMRWAGLNPDEIEPALLRWTHENCEAPINEIKVKNIAQSMGKYKAKDHILRLIMAGYDPESSAPGTKTTEDERLKMAAQVAEELKTKVAPFPVFPDWVLRDCSLYTGFVKPFCDKNSRYESFMFMPAFLLLLNYLGTRVRIEYRDSMLSLYLVLIGRKGKMIKSSSVKDAMRYFMFMGLLDYNSPSIRNAEGKILVYKAASPEGLGIEAQRVNCRNLTLLYDEFEALVNKAMIETSNMKGDLLTLYEGDYFSNMVKSRKETYSLNPGTYCCSLLACTTDKMFKSQWAKLGDSKKDGLYDRFYFLYQPKAFKPVTSPIAINTQDGAGETRKLIEKAVSQGVYSIDDPSPLDAKLDEGWGNREVIRAEKFALGFAVDLGLDSITDDALERGLALTGYERAVKKYLAVYETDNKEAAVQMKIMDALKTEGGSMPLRDLERKLNVGRIGTTLWDQCFAGLMKKQYVGLFGTGKPGDPIIVRMLKLMESDEDDE